MKLALSSWYMWQKSSNAWCLPEKAYMTNGYTDWYSDLCQADILLAIL